LKREIIITSDGSTTIHLPEWDEQYHSKHGAIQEAYHVFIKHGLVAIREEKLAILEIGFGTGLNCLITCLETEKEVTYVGVEAYPISIEEVSKLNYVQELKAEEHQKVFDKIHDIPWEKKQQITSNFSLLKRKQFFKDISDVETFNLIYLVYNFLQFK